MKQRIWSGACVATLGMAFLAVIPAAAHPSNEALVYHYLWLKATPAELSLQQRTVVGGLITQNVWPRLDQDSDGELSPDEQRKAAVELAAGLSLEISGQRVPWKLKSYEFPSHDQFFRSDLSGAQVLMTAPLPPVPAAGLTVRVRDVTYPRFTGSFPEPGIRPEELSVGEPVVTEDGRVFEIRLRPVGAAPTEPRDEGAATRLPGLQRDLDAGRVEPSGSNRPQRLPGLALTPARSDPLGPPPAAIMHGRAGKPAPNLNAPFAEHDLRSAPLFPGNATILRAPPPRQPESETSGLKGLLGRRLSLVEILLGLAAAFLAGMAHALAPGHGKAMVGAYLVGTRGTVRDAVLLGLVVTVTHTAGVYLLGFLLLWLTTRIEAQVVSNWLGVTSGLLVLGMGFWLFQRGLLAYHGLRPLPGHSHTGPGSHSHSHSHSHSDPEAAGEHVSAPPDNHQPSTITSPDRRPPSDSPLDDRGTSQRPQRQDLWGLVGLGVAGGMVPCADALGILIAAVSLGSVAVGLVLIAAFSLGMAAALVAIGVVMVKAHDVARRFTSEARWVKALPAVSGGLLCLLGAWLTFESLLQAGLLHVG